MRRDASRCAKASPRPSPARALCLVLALGFPRVEARRISSLARAFAVSGRGDGKTCRCLEANDPRRFCAPELTEDFIDARRARSILDGAARATFRSKDEEYPTMDADFERMDSRTRAYVSEELWPSVDSLVRARCGFARDAFITPYRVVVSKYDATRTGIARIARHEDAGDATFSVLLNDPSEFVGGGTQFFGRAWHPENDTVANLPEDYVLAPRRAGALIFHGGRVTHESVHVTRGSRYLLIGFSSVNKECCYKFEDFMASFLALFVLLMFVAIFSCCKFDESKANVKRH